MNSFSSTNSVQSFVRSLVFTISFALFFVLLTLPLNAFLSNFINESSVPLIFSLILNAYISSIISKMFYILPEWQSMVVLRLGKFDGVRGAGFFIIPPFIYSVAAIIDMRIETHQVEATATLTKDNVPTKVTAAVEFKVEDAKKAVIDVQNYKSSVIWLSTEALKNTIGSLDLKELLSEREQISQHLKKQIDEGASIYGVDVRAVRITDIDTPPSLVEELAVIARARRSAEAKQLQADAEVAVAHKIKEAGEILASAHNAMQLRELQILSEMSKEHSNMVIIYPYGDKSGAEISHSIVNSKK